ncbi:MAG: hypothetical protein ACK5L0_07365 [Candidatus Fimivivens sp.]
MAYEIYLGRCTLYGVTTVEESVSRHVAQYDAIGSGVFNIPKNVGLKNWNIKLELTQENLGQAGWCRASDLLDELHDMLEKKRGQRLVIVSDRQKLSKSVLLRDIKYETGYQGVYSVNLSLVAHVKPRVRASGVPFVARPGTRPEAPDTFKAQDAFDVVRKVNSADKPKPNPKTGAKIIFIDQKCKEVNIAGVDKKEIISAIVDDSNSTSLTEQQKEEAFMSGVLPDTDSDSYFLPGSE